MQEDTSSTLSSHGGQPCDTALDLMEEAASMEEVLSQRGASPKMLFRVTQLRRLLSICSLLLEHHVRVTLEEGRSDQPPPSHVWSGSLITDMLQKACPRDFITEAVVLALGEAVLFFGRHLYKKGFLYRNAKDVELGLRGPVNSAGRTAQVEVTVNTIQEGSRAIADAIMEKEMIARGPGHPSGLRRASQSSVATCNMMTGCESWMRGASYREVTTDEIMLMDMSRVVLTFGMLVEVVDDIGNGGPQGILHAFIGLTFFWGWEF